ncbi:MAG TPA: AMP-binding protein [Candidatus Limnocylindria bacterium]|jgi:acetyl-CoA synthetase|nr:AMP-binding protein [Candidatus Limnocylindria bacterium]
MRPAWEPTAPYLERSRLRRFAERQGHRDYASLLRWSTEDLEAFWRATERDLGIVWRTPYTQVVDISRGFPWTTWWTEGRMNYVATALRHDPARVAVIAEGEEGAVRTLTYGELAEQVGRFAAGLRSLGVKKGDRVAVFLPLTVECAVAVLAIGAIGAVFIPVFSGYGAEAIAGRLRDAEAKVLVCADGFYRRGAVVAMKETADEAADRAPSVSAVVVVDRVGRAYPKRGRDVAWSEVAHEGAVLDIADTSAEDPFMVIYTSGTTGKPKGALHVHGGFPVKAAQDLAHCFDLQERDVILWSTDIGWMMGPWLITGGLMLGATIALYDGTPDFPDASRMWSMVERHRVTHLGISPTAIRGLMRSGEDPVRAKDRSTLFVLGSTGEPWNPDPWWWYFRNVGESRCPVINYSGGTEISGGILGCTTWTSIQPCSFAGPCPGMAADVVDEQGRPVRGAVGELVIRKPWPGMTRGFWRDPHTQESRYLDTYWSRFEDVWVHGDWARIDEEGFWYIEGRSDDTLKVAGKRVGPAEVESAAVAHPAVSEAAAIGVPHEIKGEVIVVFAVLRPGHQPAPELARSVQDKVAEILGKPLRPEGVRFVTQLPKTRNAKILRRVIRGAYLGKDDLGDLSSLENPAAVDEVRALAIS